MDNGINFIRIKIIFFMDFQSMLKRHIIHIVLLKNFLKHTVKI